jgi:hypothetical protein
MTLLGRVLAFQVFPRLSFSLRNKAGLRRENFLLPLRHPTGIFSTFGEDTLDLRNRTALMDDGMLQPITLRKILSMGVSGGQAGGMLFPTETAAG